MIYPIGYYRLDNDKTHVFAAEHEDLVGMCVMSQDVKAAYDDVALQIENLRLFNHGRTETYAPMRSLESIIDAYESASSSDPTIIAHWRKTSNILTKRP